MRDPHPLARGVQGSAGPVPPTLRSDANVELERDVVGVAKLEHEASAAAGVFDRFVGDAKVVEVRRGGLKVGEGRQRNGQVVESNPVLVEPIALGRNRSQAERAAGETVDDPAKEKGEGFFGGLVGIRSGSLIGHIKTKHRIVKGPRANDVGDGETNVGVTECGQGHGDSF